MKITIWDTYEKEILRRDILCTMCTVEYGKLTWILQRSTSQSCAGILIRTTRLSISTKVNKIILKSLYIRTTEGGGGVGGSTDK